MNDHIRSMFPAVEHYTYLNSASVGPLPTTAVEAVMSQLLDVSLNGAENYQTWLAVRERARALLAAMLGARPQQIAFMRNTSDGFASVATGINWSPDDNIVSFAEEFPSNFYPWRRVRDDFGVELRLCPERNGRIDADEFINLIDKNTRVVAISAVQFATGFRADLERLGAAAARVEALFAVDVIQALGAMPLDVGSQFIDIACGAGHKWLCSPEGCGYIYLSDRAREIINPTFVGWISVETPWDFSNREQHFKPDALAWESGTSCSSLFYGLEQSLSILSTAGIAKIEQHLAALSDYLCDRASAKGYIIISSRAKAEKSQIVSLKNRNGLSPTAVYERLKAAKIVVAPRGDGVRVAPHFFNNLDDIDKLVEILP